MSKPKIYDVTEHGTFTCNGDHISNEEALAVIQVQQMAAGGLVEVLNDLYELSQKEIRKIGVNDWVEFEQAYPDLCKRVSFAHTQALMVFTNELNDAKEKMN